MVSSSSFLLAARSAAAGTHLSAPGDLHSAAEKEAGPSEAFIRGHEIIF
jgi:hypothetical protein